MGSSTQFDQELLAEQHADLSWALSVLRGKGDDQDSEGAALNMLGLLAQYGCTDLIRRSSFIALGAKHTQV